MKIILVSIRSHGAHP